MPIVIKALWIVFGACVAYVAACALVGLSRWQRREAARWHDPKLDNDLWRW